MTPHEQKFLSNWKQKIKKGIELVLSDSSQSNDLKDFCDTLSSYVPVKISHTKADKDDIPAIKIHNRLIYHAVPLGPELEPFMKALSCQGNLSGSVRKKLTKLSIPAIIKLYITPSCPHCPLAVDKIIPFTEANDQITLHIIDGTMFPELAKKDGVQSAPTLIFNNFKWTGNINVQEIANIIADENPLSIGSETLKSIIHNGNASHVANMMIEYNAIFPAFIDILVHEKWPVRLGAMVVMEEIIETSPRLAADMIDPVLDRFQSVNEQIKGDMIYLMGEAGNPATAPKLERMLEDFPDEELKTVIQEAIHSIKKRYKLL